MKLLEELKDLLKQDERLISGGELLKNRVVELALNLDKELIALLLKNERIKQHFFVDTDEALVFDKGKFMNFVNNKKFLPDSYTSFKNKIGLTADREYLAKSKEVVLSWPYKDCVLEGGQEEEDEKRKEIFYNKILAPDEIDRLLDPKVFTNFKRVDAEGEHEADDIKSNDSLMIKGNNLLALHSLKEKYAGKVKLIYIDPPYNTGGNQDTFTYNNNFNQSTWLTFIKNRLEIAKEFLRKDGFIAITIDHNELLYLGILADEIFGRENRTGLVTIVHKPEGRQNDKYFTATNEFMLVYANSSYSEFNNVALDEDTKAKFDKKDEKGRYMLKEFLNNDMMDRVAKENKPQNWYPIYVSEDLKDITLEKKGNYKPVYPITDKGLKKTWITIPETAQERINNNRLIAKEDRKSKLKIYYKFREQQRFKTHWVKKRYNATAYGTNLLRKILKEKTFSYPKSLYAVLDTIKIMTDKNDIILDFFAGSGTTGHATIELNKEDGGQRKFILIEQLDNHINVCKKRIQKVIKNLNEQGEGNNSAESINSFVYTELKELNEVFVQKIENAGNAEELLDIWNEMREDAFLSYRANEELFDENIEEFKELGLEEQKKLLLECLEYNNLYVNHSEIEDSKYEITKEDKALNKKFYGEL